MEGHRLSLIGMNMLAQGQESFALKVHDRDGPVTTTPGGGGEHCVVVVVRCGGGGHL